MSPPFTPMSRAMSDADVPAGALATIEAIADAIRRELGHEIDADPGRRTPEESDPLDRAFRSIVRSLLAADADPGADPTTLVSRTLHMVAERRLLDEGWAGDRARALIEDEPGSPDDWLCFLALSSRTQIEPLIDPDRG